MRGYQRLKELRKEINDPCFEIISDRRCIELTAKAIQNPGIEKNLVKKGEGPNLLSNYWSRLDSFANKLGIHATSQIRTICSTITRILQNALAAYGGNRQEADYKAMGEEFLNQLDQLYVELNSALSSQEYVNVQNMSDRQYGDYVINQFVRQGRYSIYNRNLNDPHHFRNVLFTLRKDARDELIRYLENPQLTLRYQAGWAEWGRSGSKLRVLHKSNKLYYMFYNTGQGHRDYTRYLNSRSP